MHRSPEPAVRYLTLAWPCPACRIRWETKARMQQHLHSACLAATPKQPPADPDRDARRAVSLLDRDLFPTCEQPVVARDTRAQIAFGVPCGHPLVAIATAVR